MDKTFVIADIGSSHENDIDKALQLIDVVALAGADAAKFQFWSSGKKLAERRGMPEMREAYEAFKLKRSWLDTLYAKCNRVGVEFMCTVFLPEDVPVLAEYIERWKVSHFETQDEELICAMRWSMKDIIISTTQANAARDNLPNEHYIFCSPFYPSKMKDYHVITSPCNVVGISDHTHSIHLGAIAAMELDKCYYIEKHIKLIDSKSPDAETAIPPVAFTRYVQGIREAQEVLNG